MHSKKTDGQQWSIRAEFTVSPQEGPEKNSPASSSQDKSGIRLSYFWKLNENANVNDTSNYRPLYNEARGPVEYKKGNLVFTSMPPSRPWGNRIEVPDSGYGSDILSLNSFKSQKPTGNPSTSDRRCRSTCNIVLCSTITNDGDNITADDQLKCKRINSLRCQTPILHSLQQKQDTSFYGCGDPWCHHVIQEEPAIESQTKYATLPPYYNTNLRDSQPHRKDVSIQTSNSLGECSAKSVGCRKKKKLKGSEKPSSHQIIDSSAQSLKADIGEKSQPPTSRNLNVNKNYGTAAHSGGPSKKPRTIHIDVYCTDTDMEPSETSSDSWENDSASTPQTVFESEKVSVTHQRAKDNALPFHLKKLYNKNISSATSIEKDDSDVDDVSTAYYPSKIDSYSTINDFSSSISSIKSWKNYSMSSCTNECDTDNFSRISLFSNYDKPVLFKPPSIGRNFFGHNKQLRNQADKSLIYGKSEQNSIEREIPEEYTLSRQNPEGSDSTEIGNSYNLPLPENDLFIYPSKSHALKIKEEIPPQQLLPYNDTKQSSTTVLPGKYTEQIATRFGQVINVFNKPGRHVGPVRNPDCSCSSCKRYLEMKEREMNSVPREM